MRITHEELTRQLQYYPDNGLFIWKINKRGVSLGSRAGSKQGRGYREIGIDGIRYREHILAWFYHYGYWPDCEIDHKNGVKTNNSIDNLREASLSENRTNVSITKRNTSGYKGVSWNKAKGKYYCVVSKDKRYYHIGVYDCPIEAAKAYDINALELHGDFAVTNASLGLV